MVPSTVGRVLMVPGERRLSRSVEATEINLPNARTNEVLGVCVLAPAMVRWPRAPVLGEIAAQKILVDVLGCLPVMIVVAPFFSRAVP